MINPEQLDLKILPSVALSNKKQLPEISGIYFAIAFDGSVQYIGRSNNIKTRWVSHHREYQLKKIGNIRIAYLLVSEVFLLNEIEQALIDWFQPYLNFTDVDYGDRKKERVVFYVSEEVKRKLSKLAEAENRSLSNWLENLSLKEINNRWAEESED